MGNITAPRVTLEDGSKFKGSIDMAPGDSSSSHKVPTDKSDNGTPPRDRVKETTAAVVRH